MSKFHPDQQLLHRFSFKYNQKLLSLMAGFDNPFQLRFTRHFHDRMRERGIDLLDVVRRLRIAIEGDLCMLLYTLHTAERGFGAYAWDCDGLTVTFSWSSQDPATSGFTATRMITFRTCYWREGDFPDRENWLIQYEESEQDRSGSSSPYDFSNAEPNAGSVWSVPDGIGVRSTSSTDWGVDSAQTLKDDPRGISECDPQLAGRVS